MAVSEVSNAIREVEKALSSQIEDIKNTSTISCLILSVCLIDVLAGFMAGLQMEGSERRESGKRFKNFVEKYLNEYHSFLYEIRNGIVHSFSNPDNNFMFVMNSEFINAFPDLKRLLNKQIFDVVEFKDALAKAHDGFFQDVGDLENIELRENFMKRFSKFGIIKDGVIGIGRNLQGEIISNIEQADRLPGMNVPIMIADTIKVKK